jgi:glycosyltransferase involved in cell wall biosynthesis
MRILILSDINSAHTQKWVNALADKGIVIGLFSLSIPANNLYKEKANIQVLSHTGFGAETFNSKSASKISYLKIIPQLKKVIKDFQPDVVHAHYATSYGLLGALSGFKPYFVSAWGSDVMDFPNRSFLHKRLLQYVFKRATVTLATSNAIVHAIEKVSKTDCKVISFGIDLNVFKPIDVKKIVAENTIVIGTIKSLAPIYGIDILIRAFKKVVDAKPEIKLKLLIVGGGVGEQEYKGLVKQLNIQEHVVFTGKVEYNKVVEYHNMIDIFVNVSRNESFGVSVLEASACKKPVIVSNVGGLPEVVDPEKTGIIVPPVDIEATANALIRLVENETLRNEMGQNGRDKVNKEYNWDRNIEQMIDVYKQLK